MVATTDDTTEADLIRRSAARWAAVAEQDLADLRNRTPEQDLRDLAVLFNFARQLRRERPDPTADAIDAAEDSEWRARWIEANHRVG